MCTANLLLFCCCCSSCFYILLDFQCGDDIHPLCNGLHFGLDGQGRDMERQIDRQRKRKDVTECGPVDEGGG